MTLLPPGEDPQEEHYRFVYYGQNVPAEVFKPAGLEKLQLGLLIVLAVVSVAGIILIAYVFVKWVVPALGVLKNRMLVEDKADPRD